MSPSAYLRAFVGAAAAGRFKQLQDRDDLWKLLTAIARMKAVDQIRRQTAQRRGGTNVRGESIVAGSDDAGGGLDQLAHGQPTPEFVALMEEQQQQMFAMLPDQSLRDVASLRFEGYSNEEIAKATEISLRSVERETESDPSDLDLDGRRQGRRFLIDPSACRCGFRRAWRVRDVASRNKKRRPVFVHRSSLFHDQYFGLEAEEVADRLETTFDFSSDARYTSLNFSPDRCGTPFDLTSGGVETILNFPPGGVETLFDFSTCGVQSSLDFRGGLVVKLR